MKKILVTGGAGYIGSHTVYELAKAGDYEITVFDNLNNGHEQAIEMIRRKTGQEIKLIEGELLDEQRINSTLAEEKPDTVIHFAALIEAGVSVVEPLKFYENNVSGTTNLLKAMQANGVQNIVFSSTAAVYGTPDNPEVHENTETKPENPYGHSKLMVENILRSLTAEEIPTQKRINSVILRYFNAAGADPDLLLGQDYPRPTHLITIAVQAALGQRDKLTIFGNDYPTSDGTCIRDYIHVQDLASAHVAALEKLKQMQGSEIYNVGTGEGKSNLEVVKMLEELHGEFKWEYGERRPGDPVSFYANNEKIRKELDWQPKYTVKDALAHAYSWQKTFPNGYADRIKTEIDQ
jgi:UDP-glucose 4-epimerase